MDQLRCLTAACGHIRSLHGVLFNYSALRGTSSCATNVIYRGSEGTLGAGHTPARLPESYLRARAVPVDAPYRLALLLVVYSRELLQQIQRAVRRMESDDVVMFIHVDRSSDSAYLRRELVEYAERRPS